MKFRSDINGLRAIAVIAVVLFHFNAAWMPGGFAGVDVFFVISGFLMTGIIFTGLEQENFSILKFYVARANRIIPALAVLCLVLLMFGWFYLIPTDYKELGKHAYSSIGFFSNFTYWRESGYFDAASHEKWLLHTWSLSVEWQFYIIYPLVLVAMRKFMSLEVIKAIVLIVTILGFIFCIIATYKWPNASYYLLFTRAWEMMLGGVAFLYPITLNENRKKLIEWTGLVLIIASYFLITKDSPWPGYLAVFPVLGSFLIIQAQRRDSFITSNVVSQKLGAWSYSIYLWHWPLVVAIYYYSLSDMFIYVGIPLSLFLGFLSNKYVEKIRFENNFGSISSYFKFKPFYIAATLSVASVWIYQTEPNKHLHPMPKSVLESFHRVNYKCFDKEFLHTETSEFCTITSGTKKIFAIGDSHLYSSLPAIVSLARKFELEFTYAGYSGCPPLIGVYPLRRDQETKDCNLLNEKVINHIINSKYDYAFLSARWTYYTEGGYSGSGMQYLTEQKDGSKSKAASITAFKEGIKSTFKKYSKSPVQVFVMLQVPMQEKSAKNIYYNSVDSGELRSSLLIEKSVSLEKHLDFQKLTNKIILTEARKYHNVTVIDPTLYFCGEKRCPLGNTDGSYYLDADHLSTFGSFKLIPLIADIL